MRRVMIFLPPKNTPSPAPTPTPTPSPLPPVSPIAPPVAFAEKQTENYNPVSFKFYIVDGQNNKPEVVCLQEQHNLNFIAGPYDDYNQAKKIQNDLIYTPPTP